ncbi:MAG: EAL domain-containing protein [Raoultibacter sp.]
MLKESPTVSAPLLAEAASFSPEDVFSSLPLSPCNALDPLTDLRGNYDFRAALDFLCQADGVWAVLIVGIDEFKGINDLYSYSFGDAVLKEFAALLTSLTFGQTVPFRLDGDGFGLIFASKRAAVDFYVNLKDRLRDPLDVEGNKILLTASAGMSGYPCDGASGEMLYRNARMTLRMAKTCGKDQLVVYSDEILKQEQFKMKLLNNLKDCVKRGFEGFSLRFQPLVRAHDGDLYGCEVLLRWGHPDFPEEVTPYVFIPALEESGLILEVGRWVLATALGHYASLARLVPDFQMNINVSSKQFEDPDFKFFVVNTVAEHHIDPAKITLELTESGQITDTEKMSQVFEFLRGQGIKIALDDFGTGYASFELFRVLSADQLKIDRSFLERLSYDVTDQKIITQIVNLCHSMNMTVCVEGIECPETETIVRQLGPELMQGYYFNMPMTLQEFERFYQAKPHNAAEILPETVPPEHENSMAYAPFRPAQPMSMEEIVDNAHAGIFQVGMDHEFTFLTCNEGYRRMLGYTARQMDEKFKNQALGFVHPDDVDYVNEEIRRQLNLGDTVTIEFRVVKANGDPIWILGTGNVVKNRHGNASLVVVIIDNNRIQTQNLSTQQQVDFFESVLSNITVGVKCVRFDVNFTIDYISPSFLSILGYTRDEVRTLFDDKYINMIYPDDIKVVTNDILEQLKVGNVVTLRYRTPCKDGRLIWVKTVSRLCPPDPDGVQRAYSSVIDVSNRAGEEPVDISAGMTHRYQSAVQQWGDVLFEYDFKSDTLSFSDNYQNVFGRACQTTVQDELAFVHEDDVALLYTTFEAVRQGKQPQLLEVRLLTKQGRFRWYSVRFTLPDMFGDTPVSAIGKISDIDDERRERDNLVSQTEKDAMTDLLNKGTIERKVRSVLDQAGSSQHYALFIIDIDDFKHINDRRGHFNGDKVICEIARRLKVLFRAHDLVGRAGGDEFMAFIPFDGDEAVLVAKAEAVVAKMREPLDLDGEQCTLSGSVGVSCFPNDGTQFYDLFRRADSALYRAKELGKDGYCLAAK